MNLQPYNDLIGFLTKSIALVGTVSGCIYGLYLRWKKNRLRVTATVRLNPAMVELFERAKLVRAEMQSSSFDTETFDGPQFESTQPWPYLYVTAKNIGVEDQMLKGVLVEGIKSVPVPLKSNEPTDELLRPQKEQVWKVELNPAHADRISSIYAVTETGKIWRASRQQLGVVRRELKSFFLF